MEEKLNLIEILRNAPIGIKLYSPICGECELVKVIQLDCTFPIHVQTEHDDILTFTKKGHLYDNGISECLLFPSRENRDWSSFKVDNEYKEGDHVKVKTSDKVYLIKRITKTGIRCIECNSDSDFELSIDKSTISEKVTKFDPSWLKPFDRVLVKDTLNEIWDIALFSRIGKHSYVIEVGYLRTYCIPYNTETKHLLGTSLEEPEFYKV